MKSTLCDSSSPQWGDWRDSGYETWQLDITSGDLGLHHAARGGERGHEHQPAKHSCSLRPCPGGKPCKSCSLQSQGSSSRGGSCLPLSRGHSCAGGSARARGILHTQGCSLSSVQLVPLTAIWKYLSSCFGAKEQLAYTLLLLHYPP